MEFGKKLKELREKMGLTQSDVVRLMGVDSNSGREYLSLRGYMAYEQNNTRPRKRIIYERLADVFLCNVNYLLTDETNMEFIANGGSAWNYINKIMPRINLTKRIIINYDLKYKGNLYNIWAGIENDDIKKEHTKEYINELNTKYSYFSAVAFKILIQDMMLKGISCVIADKSEESDDGIIPDDILILNNENISECWIYYFPANLLSIKINDYNYIIKEYIKKLVLFGINEKRKYTIATDDIDLYDYLIKQKQRFSLYANVSVIKVNTAKYCIDDELELFSINKFNKSEEIKNDKQ